MKIVQTESKDGIVRMYGPFNGWEEAEKYIAELVNHIETKNGVKYIPANCGWFVADFNLDYHQDLPKEITISSILDPKKGFEK